MVEEKVTLTFSHNTLKKKKSACGMIHTEHLLKAGRSQTSKKGNETSK